MDKIKGGLGTPLITALVVVLVGLFPLMRAPSITPAGLKGHKNLAPAFTVGFPENWRELSGPEFEGYRGIFSFVIKRDRPEAQVGFRARSARAGIGLAEVAEVLDKTMTKRFNQVQKLSAATVSLKSGEKALAQEYRFLAPGRAPIREKMLIVPTKKNIFYVTAWAEESEYLDVQRDIEQILGSFRLN
jgi:hypothetical protein